MVKTQKPGDHGQSRKESTRDKILNAATQEDVPPCLSAINMKAIAERAGVSRQTAYRHFQDRGSFVEQMTEWLSDRFGEFKTGPSLESFRGAEPDDSLPPYYTEKIERNLFSENFFRLFFCSLMDANILENPYVKGQSELYAEGKREGTLSPDIDEDVTAVMITLTMWLGPYLFARSQDSEEGQKKALERYFKTYRQIIHSGIYNDEKR